MQHAERLLLRVQRRLRLRATGKSFGLWLPAVAVLYLVFLLATRWFGFGPTLEPWTVALVPAVAAVLALLTCARPGQSQAATATDVAADSRDLFLARSWLEQAPGEFGPLVAERAEERARELRAEKVVPFDAWRGAGIAAAVLLLLLAGAVWLPRSTAPSKTEISNKQAEALKEQAKETERKVAALREQQLAAANSEAVAAAVQQLEQMLRQAQKAAVAENQAKLQEQQRQFGEAWRQAHKTGAQGSEGAGTQEFGAGMDARMQEWKKELERGEAGALQRELERLQSELAKLGKSAQGQRSEQLSELRKQLEKLADLAAAAGRGSPADQALAQALEQMQMLAASELSPEAMAALQQSLELAQLELGKQAQGTRDLQTLEQALRAIQMARQLNEMGQLDGKESESCQSLADYEKLYNERMQERLANGEGMP